MPWTVRTRSGGPTRPHSARLSLGCDPEKRTLTCGSRRLRNSVENDCGRFLAGPIDAFQPRPVTGCNSSSVAYSRAIAFKVAGPMPLVSSPVSESMIRDPRQRFSSDGDESNLLVVVDGLAVRRSSSDSSIYPSAYSRRASAMGSEAESSCSRPRTLAETNDLFDLAERR